MRRALLAAALCLAFPAHAWQESVILEHDGIQITARQDHAYVITSLVKGGWEYVNTFAVGADIQFAWAHHNSECWNPTEGGNVWDADGTSSRPIESWTGKDGRTYWHSGNGGREHHDTRRIRNSLLTATDAAYWLMPGQPYANGPCLTGPASMREGNLIYKEVTIEDQTIVRFDSMFVLPRVAIPPVEFEFPTAYMPPEMSVFRTYDVPRGVLSTPLYTSGDYVRYTPDPVIACTPDGLHCLGQWSPMPGTLYGRYYIAGLTAKTNCQSYQFEPLPAGNYEFRCYVVVGTLIEVTAAITQLKGQ